MAIEYTEKWLENAKALVSSTVGWFKPKTYEVLKGQKGLTGDAVPVEHVFLVIPDVVEVDQVVSTNVRFLPKVATETDYTVTISDETKCTFDTDKEEFTFIATGDVDITVTIGTATVTKTIKVEQNAHGVSIVEGNAFIKGVEKTVTFKLYPDATTEVIEDVDLFQNPTVSINPVEADGDADVSNQYKVKSDILGNYTLRVKTDRANYKCDIWVVEDESLIATGVTVDDLESEYGFNELILLDPKFTPETATKLSYKVTVDDDSIATYNSGKNAIQTLSKVGETKAKITLDCGNVVGEFNINVIDRDNPSVKVTSIDINGLPTEIEVDQIEPFTIVINPEDASNKEVDTVASGAITLQGTSVKGISVGTGTLTVTAKDGSGVVGTKNINVKDKTVLVTGINLSAVDSQILADGVRHPITYTVEPTNATNKTVDITSTGVIKIDGDNFYADAVGTGTFKITSKDGSNKSVTSATITVNAVPVPVTSVDITITDTNILSDGVRHNLTTSVLPANADNKNVTVTSSGVIKLDGNTKYYADAVGTGTITVTSVENTAIKKTSGTITVTAPVVKVTGLTINGLSGVDVKNDSVEHPFTVDVAPANATDKTYTVTSSGVVKLNGAKTAILASEEGVGKLIVTANDGSGIKSEIDITVTAV